MKIDTITIDILGSKWTIRSGTHETDKELDEYTGAVTDVTTREIIINDRPADQIEIRDESAEIRRFIRHEIIHAFLFESGLYENALSSGAWPMNEEMIDFFAIQHEKIHKVFKDAGALDSEANVDKLHESLKWISKACGTFGKGQIRSDENHL